VFIIAHALARRIVRVFVESELGSAKVSHGSKEEASH
jgi:hypothetical protein